MGHKGVLLQGSLWVSKKWVIQLSIVRIKRKRKGLPWNRKGFTQDTESEVSLEGWEDLLGEKEGEIHSPRREGKRVKVKCPRERLHLFTCSQYVPSLPQTCSCLLTKPALSFPSQLIISPHSRGASHHLWWTSVYIDCMNLCLFLSFPTALWISHASPQFRGEPLQVCLA